MAAGAKDAEVCVWPENWPSFEVFHFVRTQWRTGFSGAVGLDYSAVYPLLDKLTDDKNEWKQMLVDINVMEAAALDSMKKED